MNYRLGIYEKAMPPGMAFDTMLSAARDAGFDFLEISIDESDERQARLDWNPEQIANLAGAIRRTRVPISTLCLEQIPKT